MTVLSIAVTRGSGSRNFLRQPISRTHAPDPQPRRHLRGGMRRHVPIGAPGIDPSSLRRVASIDFSPPPRTPPAPGQIRWCPKKDNEGSSIPEFARNPCGFDVLEKDWFGLNRSDVRLPWNRELQSLKNRRIGIG